MMKEIVAETDVRTRSSILCSHEGWKEMRVMLKKNRHQ
jgi:hypothetical protein